MELIEHGRMMPAGLAEVERAKADGRWDAAYEGSKTIEVPAELRAALDAEPVAAAFFETLTSQNRYEILFRLHNLQTAAARSRNVQKYVAMLARRENLSPATAITRQSSRGLSRWSRGGRAAGTAEHSAAADAPQRLDAVHHNAPPAKTHGHEEM